MRELVIKYIDKVIEYYASKEIDKRDLLKEMSVLSEPLEICLSYEKVNLICDLSMNAHFCNRTHQHIYKAYQAFGYDDLNELIEVE